jgi:hypothetical protein
LIALLSQTFSFLGRKVWNLVRDKGSSGSGVWIAIGILLAGVKTVLKLGRRRRQVVYSSELQPDESLSISHLPRLNSVDSSLKSGS